MGTRGRIALVAKVSPRASRAARAIGPRAPRALGSGGGLIVWCPGGGERGRRQAPQRGVRAAVVVVLAPVLDDDLRFGQAGEQLDVEQLVANSGVKGLHERVLPRRAGLDERRRRAGLPAPVPE